MKIAIKNFKPDQPQLEIEMDIGGVPYYIRNAITENFGIIFDMEDQSLNIKSPYNVLNYDTRLFVYRKCEHRYSKLINSLLSQFYKEIEEITNQKLKTLKKELSFAQNYLASDKILKTKIKKEVEKPYKKACGQALTLLVEILVKEIWEATKR
jgi:hypothetical protein